MVPPWFINGTLSRTLTKNVEKLKQHLAWEKKTWFARGPESEDPVRAQVSHCDSYWAPNPRTFWDTDKPLCHCRGCWKPFKRRACWGVKRSDFFLINVGGSNNCNCFRTASSTLDWWKITKLLFAERNSSCESWVCHKLKTEMLLSFCLTTSMIHLFTQRGRHASCWTTQASEVGDHICWQLRKFNHYGSV